MIEVQAFYEVFANNSVSKSAHYKLCFYIEYLMCLNVPELGGVTEYLNHNLLLEDRWIMMI